MFAGINNMNDNPTRNPIIPNEMLSFLWFLIWVNNIWEDAKINPTKNAMVYAK